MVGGHGEAEEEDDEGREGVAGDGVGFRGCPVGVFGRMEVGRGGVEGGVEEGADVG